MMTAGSIPFDDWLAERMKDPEFKAEWDKPKPLQLRITELAYGLRESDPELSAWILRMQATRRPKRRQAEQRAWVGRKTKGRAFKVPAKMIEEGEET